MRKFVAQHAALTTGTLSCFDRLPFKGHLSLGYPHGMADFLNHQGVLFKQLKPLVLRQAERIRTHSHALAEKAGRPWQYFESQRPAGAASRTARALAPAAQTSPRPRSAAAPRRGGAPHGSR